MSRRKANARGPSPGRPKRREDPPPRPKPDEPIPPETAEGMGLPLNDDEHKKRAEALRRSQDQGEGVVMDWIAAADRARKHLGARERTFTEAQSLALIDDFAARGTVTSAQMQQHGAADFIRTILGHVTTAVHGGGSVPKAGGWYRTEAAGSVYIIDPEFAEAWNGGRLAHGS